MKLPSRIYHLADADNWSSIRNNGLLSTSALLRQSGVVTEDRDRIERSQRLQDMVLPNGVRLRDQKPMPPEALEQCLVGMTPTEWYALINSKVFFWVDLGRLDRQRMACARRPQVILGIDTARLVMRYADHITLSRINTGNARRRPAKRGRCTFVPYGVWLESGWLIEAKGLGTRPCSRNIRPAELTIPDGVPDIMCFVVRVHKLRQGRSSALQRLL